VRRADPARRSMPMGRPTTTLPTRTSIDHVKDDSGNNNCMLLSSSLSLSSSSPSSSLLFKHRLLN
jgi:hypothetical protein